MKKTRRRYTEISRLLVWYENGSECGAIFTLLGGVMRVF